MINLRESTFTQVPWKQPWCYFLNGINYFIRSQLLSAQNSFKGVTKLLNNCLEAHLEKISALYCQKKLNKLKYIGKIFRDFH
ncbi:uncharacterized protein VP01_1416g3 [Puccinia sorghi]|uniref:Uncharacterized protein n=1 Tax=Puccinia sorghi TaxID=27349 RepID=A0A0L6VKR6_9BASI|nr:uncharacterized protein VP01_1416g3 [Puccinia sorghi]